MPGVDVRTMKKVNAGLQSGSLLLLTLGFAMSFWVWNDTTHSGLWRICGEQRCVSIGIDADTSFGAIQIMMCAGLFFHFFSVILHYAWSCQSKSKGVSSVAMAAFAFSIMAGFSILTSVLTFVYTPLMVNYHVCVFMVAYSGLISTFAPIISLTAQCMMGAPAHGVAPAKP